MNILLAMGAVLLLLALPRIAYAKGGGSRQVDATGPKSQQLIDLENQFYGLSNTLMGGYLNPLSGSGVPQPYDNNIMMGQLLNDATQKTYQSNARYDELLNNSPHLTTQNLDALDRSKTAGDPYFGMAMKDYEDAQRYLAQAGTAGDWWYDQAKNAYGNASSILNSTTEANKWYDDYSREMLGGAKNLMETGQIPQPLVDAMQAAIKGGIDKSVGANVSDLALRGVINSSVANRGLSDASNAVGDSMVRGYLDSFNSLLGGYNQSAATSADAGRAFAESNLSLMRDAVGLGESYGKTGSMRVGDMLGVAQGHGNNANSLMNAGSQRVGDWLKIAGGYNDALGANLQERDQLLKAVPQYYQNAMAPTMASYDLLKTMQQDHWNSNKKDTIVKQGK